MLPAVTLLLVVGAAFVVLAWSEAGDAVRASEQRDDDRADRVSTSIDEVLLRRWLDQSRWADDNAGLLAPGNEGALARELTTVVGGGSSSATAAWLVIREDGSVAGVGETTPGRIAANGLADDLRALGRQTASRGEPQVSGRLKLGEEYVYATAVPAGGDGDVAAVVVVTYLDRSTLGAFIGDRGNGDEDAARVLDERGRVLLGPSREPGGDVVARDVGSSGWSVEIPRVRTEPLLPSWAYPLFALLLVVFAGAYAFQDLKRRRLIRIGDRRAHEAQLLYELASRVLHAGSVEVQAEELARGVLELVDVDLAVVRLEAAGDPVEHRSGYAPSDAPRHTVPIEGPRGPVGELTVARSGAPIDAEEGWVLQTAAALVGAAVDTLSALETERSAAAELQRLDELRNNLLATVAHELLSPLTAVKGVLGLLSMQDDLGARGREYVDVATERTDRLVALIHDLFDCSLLETGQLDIRPKRQRADELLDSALGAQAAARPGELRLSATENLLITVDPVRFDQLVNNLVTNAFRHGAPPVEVAIRPADGGVVVVVADEGNGIPEAEREEVFGKFWQGSSGHARAAEGAGLGLSLVHGLVQVHGGHITVDSTHADGRGARFTAFFPDGEWKDGDVVRPHGGERVDLGEVPRIA
jgi:signal transduction histidine kinase